MASEAALSERLRWTVSWQTHNLMPLLERPGAEARLREYWVSARRMADVLDRVALDDASLCLDVGGGLTTPLRWLPGRHVCVDPLSEHYAARFALPHRRVTYAAGRGEALPLVSGVCDLVICTNCIDHTDDPGGVMSEIGRVLRPGGWLWFSCEENPPGLERNAGHPHALDRRAIRALVDDFEVLLAWEEPWRGVYGHLLERDAFPAVEHGFLVRKTGGGDAR